jgi:hypothetical protein
MITPISSFSEIEVVPNSLVILDIDETVLTFPQITKHWWKEKIGYYYDITTDIHLAEKYALDEWRHIAYSTDPIQLDSENQLKFIDNIYQNNCELIFLTARNEDLSCITYNHLRHINIDNRHLVYFDENKGEKFYEIISSLYQNCENITFVDDLIINLDKIVNAINKYELNAKNIKLYHMAHK